MQLAFQKMHGCGNDFIIIDARKQAVALSAQQITQLANRKKGIGCDQLIMLLAAPNADAPNVDALMHIYNADGSRVSTCGNATRCVGDLLMRQTGRDIARIDTDAGLREATRMADGNICVSMGKPCFDWQKIPLQKACDTLHLDIIDGALKDPVAVSMGNPHMVFFVDDLENMAALDWPESGARLEKHPLFVAGANVSIVQVAARDRLHVRTFERGAGVTLACGSAACAALGAGVMRGKCETAAQICMSGGNLNIDWQKETSGEMLMQGSVAYVFEGVVSL
jgi:diaminopimelate epimerase